MRIDIKPLSVNEAWKGKRYKTDKYKRYEWLVLLMLKELIIPRGNKRDLKLSLVFGFSNSASDFDNPVKPFVDCLQKKYLFNDRRIKRCVIDVEMVKKGSEFIEFEIERLGGDCAIIK